MSLRCNNCTSAFFSQKLLDQHKKKCSAGSAGRKTRYTVSVRRPDEELAQEAAARVSAVEIQQPPQQQQQEEELQQQAEDEPMPALQTPDAKPQQQQREEQQPPAVHVSIVDAENVSPVSGVVVRSVSGAQHQQQQQHQAQHHARLLRADIPLRSPANRRRVACNACGKLFAGPRCCNWLADHLRIEHLDQPPHACPHCGSLFVYFDTLQEHVASSHSSDGAGAVNAAAVAADPSAAAGVGDVVKQQLPDEQPDVDASSAESYAYCCGLCNETYSDLQLLLKHFADLHPEFASPDELVAAATAPLMQQQQQILYACTLCSQSFDQLMSGQLHLQRSHPAEWRQVVCCPVCQLNCKTESLNQAHIRSVHANPKSLPEGPASCRLCLSARVQLLGGAKSAQDASRYAGADQLYEHLVAAHCKPMSAYIVQTTAAAVAAGGDTLYECGGCKARYKDRMLLEQHFQAGCPSLTGAVSEAQQHLADPVDDAAYLQSGVLTA